ncbi:MAG TPA: sigma 54-interacting transcriptional regulator [Bacillota bacterium]|nr:sigma 54-interacting transcriptional regulator [Bacillota bacterium]HQE65227.1 sigma 54-interacting transcriptional regulator [Bacillota bacterium]HQI15675.1 sigma 54-interacting transcriptional regulator [Bacillota bacterium]HQJ37099.1 sigma 54-interacting transcriptional regulator [Bacillota bacterium]HQL35413.1 sigma 54-interacting transcriptional regulator [Bacillota bacterium]
MSDKNEMNDIDIFDTECGELLKLVLDGINDAICVVDINCITRYWNKAAEKLYQIDRESIINRHIKEFFPNSLLPRIIKEKKAYDNIYNNPKEGCYNVISASPLYMNGRLVGGISLDRDATEFIKTSELLVKAQSNLNVLEHEISIINKNRYSFSQILGNNRALRDSIRLARDISRSNINVLITGESGTGKELFARAIHMESNREGYFVPINCSAIPNELIESELFGYAAGAFTGALKTGKIGKMELANNGTLFLDEIGDMPLSMQPKILRVLENGEMTKIGSEKTIKTNIRIITATNKNLSEMVEAGLFRKDLYYRLNSVVINLPPLRERKDDIPLLVNRFIEDYCMEYGINILGITPEVLDSFVNHSWEGNIRELKNVIERIVVLARNSNTGVIDASFLPQSLGGIRKPIPAAKQDSIYDLNTILENAEREALINVMRISGGNKAHCAKLLNIPRSTLYFKLKKHNLEK